MGGWDLAGRVVMITGATSGLGREAALALAESHPRLYLVARDRDRAAATMAEIEQRTGHTDVHVLLADLSARPPPTGSR